MFAVWVSQRPAAGRYSWGYHRWEVIGALASVALIWILTAVLCLEAVNRILHPEAVDGKVMFITAAAGLAVNLMMMRVLHQGGGHSHGGHSHGGGGGHSHGGGGGSGECGGAPGGGGGTPQHENLNVTAAYIHVLGDLVQSVGVLIAAAIIWAYPEAHIADPICTFIFSVLVLFTTTSILRSAVGSILNAVPPYVSLADLTRGFLALPGVSAVYALHVWEYGGVGDREKVALSCHIVSAGDPAATLAGALLVAAGAGIAHPTIQVEAPGARAPIDAAVATLDVFPIGREPPPRLLADLADAVVGVCLGRSGGGGGGSPRGREAPLFRLAPPPAGAPPTLTPTTGTIRIVPRGPSARALGIRAPDAASDAPSSGSTSPPQRFSSAAGSYEAPNALETSSRGGPNGSLSPAPLTVDRE